MRFSDKKLSQIVTQLCLAKQIDNIVISPGSRNAPLIIGFTEHLSFKNFSIVDERCAAFFALGMAQQLKKPVALVCTSGSALLNYYPAIAEAFYSNIPLVILSADRPENLIDVGDGQTIRQENVYTNHILYSANCKEGDDYFVHNETQINIALNTAIELQGPVHINLPFSEPLYKSIEDLQVRPQHVPARIPSEEIKEDLSSFLKQWNESEKKMILIGVLTPGSIEEKYIDTLAVDSSVIVLTETTSNTHHKNFFPAIDQLIAPLEDEDFKRLQPDILLTFGGMIVSKKIKSFLRNYTPKTHWHVDTKNADDTFFCLEHHFKTSPNTFLKSFLEKSASGNSTYQKDWLAVKEHRLQKHTAYVNEIPFSDFKVFSEIFKNIPSDIQLQLSNSTAIRYAQLFQLHPSLNVFCNRGTSGIDGSMSTAVGAAFASSNPTVFITGDLSFLYDSNALWNNYIPKDFKIIILNNEGGGIFRILPGAKDTEHFDRFFETKHHLSAKHLAEMYDFEYTSVKEENRLVQTLTNFFSSSEKPKILEIFTPSELNDTVLLNYFKYIK